MSTYDISTLILHYFKYIRLQFGTGMSPEKGEHSAFMDRRVIPRFLDCVIHTSAPCNWVPYLMA